MCVRTCMRILCGCVDSESLVLDNVRFYDGMCGFVRKYMCVCIVCVDVDVEISL